LGVIQIVVGDLRFAARLETERAPKTVARFRTLLPLATKLIQARWSGEAGWIPFGDLDLDLGYENQTSYPAPGQLLLYPGGLSETEILFPFGPTVFASKAGAPTNPDWYQNLKAHPDVTFEIGDETIDAVTSEATGEERDRLFRSQAALSPQFGEYEKKAGRVIPVMVLTPAQSG